MKNLILFITSLLFLFSCRNEELSYQNNKIENNNMSLAKFPTPTETASFHITALSCIPKRYQYKAYVKTTDYNLLKRNVYFQMIDNNTNQVIPIGYTYLSIPANENTSQEVILNFGAEIKTNVTLKVINVIGDIQPNNTTQLFNYIYDQTTQNISTCPPISPFDTEVPFLP